MKSCASEGHQEAGETSCLGLIQALNTTSSRSGSTAPLSRICYICALDACPHVLITPVPVQPEPFGPAEAPQFMPLEGTNQKAQCRCQGFPKNTAFSLSLCSPTSQPIRVGPYNQSVGLRSQAQQLQPHGHGAEHLLCSPGDLPCVCMSMRHPCRGIQGKFPLKADGSSASCRSLFLTSSTGSPNSPPKDPGKASTLPKTHLSSKHSL